MTSAPGPGRRRLGEVQRALRQAHPVDRAGRRVGDQQRLRIGVADVLGGEDDHPTGDEARVLAPLQHHRQVVEGGIDVGAAGRLDPGGDEVVVAVTIAVVVERLALQRVLDRGDVDRLPLGSLDRPLQRRERDPRIAAARLASIASAASSIGGGADEPALAISERPPQQHFDLPGSSGRSS